MFVGWYIFLFFFVVQNCDYIEVTGSNVSLDNGYYVRTDDRASAPTKKSIWKLSNKTYFIYYTRSAKAWRLGHRTHLFNEDYYYTGKY